jgi:phage terminase large subunit-like protein
MLGAEIARAVVQGGQGLCISAPPRHGKSKLITVATPLWVLENFPNKNVIVATYGEELSIDFTREVKDIIKANQTKLNVRIRRDVDRGQNFMTVEGGGLKAVGLRGTITGRGADVLIIDDYIKEPKEALNNDYLESLKTWFRTVARTRLEPNATVIVVATRWVTNDLHGHIERLEQQRTIAGRRNFYKIIKIPAIAGTLIKDPDDPRYGTWVEPADGHKDILGRAAGEPLFAQRYTAEALEDIRIEVTNRWFEAMFQQDPASEDSAVTDPGNIKFLTRDQFEAHLLTGNYATKKSLVKRRRGWDFASSKEHGDFTAGPLITYLKDTQQTFLEELTHGQFSAKRVEEEFTKCHMRDPLDVEYVIEQEPGSAGVYAFEHFKGLAPGRRIRAAKSAALGSKLLKSQPLLSCIEARRFFIVVDHLQEDGKFDPNCRQARYVNELIEEFTSFPGGSHDDIVDALGTAYNDASGRKPLGGAFGRTKAAQDKREEIDLNNGIQPDTVNPNTSGTFGRRASVVAATKTEVRKTASMVASRRRSSPWSF